MAGGGGSSIEPNHAGEATAAALTTVGPRMRRRRPLSVLSLQGRNANINGHGHGDGASSSASASASAAAKAPLNDASVGAKSCAKVDVKRTIASSGAASESKTVKTDKNKVVLVPKTSGNAITNAAKLAHEKTTAKTTLVATTSPFRTPPNTRETLPNRASNTNNDSRAVTTPKSSSRHRHRHRQQQQNNNPSFFSPPRALRQPPCTPGLLPSPPNYKDYPGTEDVRLLRNPWLTLRYAVEGVYNCALRNVKWPWGRGMTMVLSSALLVVAMVVGTALHGGYGPHVQSLLQLYLATITEAAFWFGCGVLSTAGLGSGVQTGALVLFPHVCSLALGWVDLNGMDENHGGGEEQSKSFGDLMWSVAVPGFWSGTGSAVGELLPYVLARFIRAAGGDPFALLDEELEEEEEKVEKSDSNKELGDEFEDASDDAGGGSKKMNKKKKSWTGVLLANTRSAMERQMSQSSSSSSSSHAVFFKIFLLAAVPNGLFDLCGLVCGSTGVPFWTFFGAVWSGKALVRTPLQTCGLAAGVVMLSSSSSSSSLDEDNDESDELEEGGGVSFCSVRASVVRFGRETVTKFIRGVDNDSTVDALDDVETRIDPSSFVVTAIKTMWTVATIWILGFFVLSTVEQIAQHHAKTLRSRSQQQPHQQRRGGGRRETDARGGGS